MRKILLEAAKLATYLRYTDDEYSIRLISNDVNRFVKTCCGYYDLPEASDLFSTFVERYHLLEITPKFREHLIHQFQVFLLGCYVMFTLSKGLYHNFQNLFKKSLKNNGYNYGEPADFFYSWFLASLFHDVGGVVERSNKWIGCALAPIFLRKKEEGFPVAINWSDFFQTLWIPKSFETLCRYISKMISYKEQDLNMNLRSLLYHTPDHGLISSLALLNHLWEPMKEKENVLVPAAAAIALHSERVQNILLGPGGIKYFNFKKDPLSFLLIYCDTAQQWGRPETNSQKGEEPPKFKSLEIKHNKIICEIEYKKEYDSYYRDPLNRWIDFEGFFSFEIARHNQSREK